MARDCAYLDGRGSATEPGNSGKGVLFSVQGSRGIRGFGILRNSLRSDQFCGPRLALNE